MTIELLTAPARQAGTLSETGHRPWPLPDGSWIMAQSWEDLLFAHWRIDADALRKLIPPALALDEHDGSAWLGVTPFVVTNLRLRRTLPLPFLSSFPEINVRTYVTAEDKPGIWFFSLDTSSRGAVEAARRLYKLPYFHARMDVDRRGGPIDYSSARRDAVSPFVFRASYEPAGEPWVVEPGSLEHFLVERYCLYASDGSGLHRADIHHPPWCLRPAEATIELNAMSPHGVELSGEPLFHLAERQDVVIWPLERVGGSGRPQVIHPERDLLSCKQQNSGGITEMKKRWVVPTLLVAALALAATAAAGSGHGKGKGHHGKFGPYDVVTDDHGSCSNAWAVDTEKRTFKVRHNNDGSYTLTRYDRGTFLTNAGRSPGACNPKGKHGATVNAGVKGKFKGYLRGRITGGTFDPNATCAVADCGFTDVWIAAFFGPSATFSCFENSKACQFGFQYHARHQGLKFHHWYDVGKGAGTFLKERFHGDIANT